MNKNFETFLNKLFFCNILAIQHINSKLITIKNWHQKLVRFLLHTLIKYFSPLVTIIQI